MDYNNLRGSIKLDGETVFHHNISQDKDKLEIYNKAVSSNVEALLQELLLYY